MSSGIRSRTLLIPKAASGRSSSILISSGLGVTPNVALKPPFASTTSAGGPAWQTALR